MGKEGEISPSNDRVDLPAYASHDVDEKGQHRGSVVSAHVIEGEIFDERYEQTQRGLKSRHAQMIALGGTIGTGLFVGSGQTLARGGPAFIFGCYLVLAFLVFCVVSAITEVGAYLPTPGSSMNLFGFRYVSRAMGFAMGWLYFYSLGILVPYEITAAGLVIDYWHSPVNIGMNRPRMCTQTTLIVDSGLDHYYDYCYRWTECLARTVL
jgi:yeast amino acid transporter